MIFIDKLREIETTLEPEIKRLINLALENQFHPGDLLLIHINGFYDESILELNQHSERKFNPHVIGPSLMGHSESAHYSFIHKYRTTHISDYTLPEYLKLHEWTRERAKEIEHLTDVEETTIQLEMLIYLKFWEADMIIKKLYQFTRILCSETYDWHFKIQESPRDSKSSGSRQDIIRSKIRDRIKEFSPILYNLIKETYKTQIRNSIAHSNYSFQGRQINLGNQIKDDPHSQRHAITFDEWITIFHNTLALHNQYIELNNLINQHYASLVMDNGIETQILVTEKEGKQYQLPLEFRPEWKDWKYKLNK